MCVCVCVCVFLLFFFDAVLVAVACGRCSHQGRHFVVGRLRDDARWSAALPRPRTRPLCRSRKLGQNPVTKKRANTEINRPEDQRR